MAKDDELAIIVNDNGYVEARFAGIGAREDAEAHKEACEKGRVRGYEGSVILTGEKAAKVLRDGRA